jgi:argonaute-like protein implicated in RNA metabolism and viral defense
MLIHLQHTTRSLVDQTLSEKSGRRVDHVFEHLKSEKFLASLAPAFPGFQRISNANDENVQIEEQHNKFVGLVQNFITLLADLLDYNNNGIRTESESQEIK